MPVRVKLKNSKLRNSFRLFFAPVKKKPGFEASFDARAARTCAAILFLELLLAVFLLVSFGV